MTDDFYSANGCCIDAWVGEPLRYAFTREEWDQEDGRPMKVLERMRSHMKMANMQVVW